MASDRRVVLLPIRSQHADRILAGEKHFELRKQLPSGRIDTVYLFVSGGEGIAGAFDVGDVVRTDKGQLWETVGIHGTSKARFERYFSETKRGVALRVIDPVRFYPAIPKLDVRALWPAFRPFNGGQLIPHDTPLFETVEAARQKAKLFLLPTLCLRDISESERPIYANLVTREIRIHYEEIDASFAEMNLRIHSEGFDVGGYITERKDVLAIEWNEVVVGFTTLTYKRSGCVKTGPTILIPEFRHRGLGQSVRRAIESRVVDQKYRKIYCTCPDTASGTLRYLLKSGLRVEAHLERHYSRDHGELILGKFVAVESGAVRHKRKYVTKKGVIKPLTRAAIKSVATAYARMFSQTFFDIPKANILEMLTRALKPGRGYADKPRFFSYANAGRDVVAIATAIPKRGGAMRLVVLRDTADVPTIRGLIENVMTRAAEKGVRKITTTVPLEDVLVTEILIAADFRNEGILRSPYRPGQDVLLMSRFTE